MLMNRQTCLPHMSTFSLNHCSADCSLFACNVCPCRRVSSRRADYDGWHNAGTVNVGYLRCTVAMVINWLGCASGLLTHKVPCMVSWCNCAMRSWIFMKLDTWIGILCYCDINWQSDFLHTTGTIKVARMLLCGVLVLRVGVLVLRVSVLVLVLWPGVLLTSLNYTSK